MLLCRSCEWRFIDIWPHTPTVYMVARFRLKNCSSYVTTLILDWWLNQLLHTNTGHTPGQDTESIEKSLFVFTACFEGRLCGCVQIQCINWYKRENQSTKKKKQSSISTTELYMSIKWGTVTGTDEVVNRRIYRGACFGQISRVFLFCVQQIFWIFFFILCCGLWCLSSYLSFMSPPELAGGDDPNSSHHLFLRFHRVLHIHIAQLSGLWAMTFHACLDLPFFMFSILLPCVISHYCA